MKQNVATEEFVPEVERLRSNLISLIDGHSEHFTYTKLTSMQKVLGTTTPQSIYIGADIKAGAYDKWVAKYSEIWPDDLAWPAGVPRPPRSKSAA